MFEDLIDFETILLESRACYRFQNATFKRDFGEWTQGYQCPLLVFNLYPIAQIAELTAHGEIVRTKDFTLSPK